MFAAPRPVPARRSAGSWRFVMGAGAAVLVAVAVVTGVEGSGGDNPSAQGQTGGATSPANGATSPAGGTTSPSDTATSSLGAPVSMPSTTAEASASPPGAPGSPLFVSSQDELGADGRPPLDPFGFRLSGSDNLTAAHPVARWTQPSSPTSQDCLALLHDGGALTLTVGVGDVLCATTRDLQPAVVKVMREDHDDVLGPYLLLDVTMGSD
jgi:hypothetical protein